MSTPPNGSGQELEKFPDAAAPPPKIGLNLPEEVTDAGLRSLDHCKYLVRFDTNVFSNSACAALVRKLGPGAHQTVFL